MNSSRIKELKARTTGGGVWRETLLCDPGLELADMARQTHAIELDLKGMNKKKKKESSSSAARTQPTRTLRRDNEQRRLFAMYSTAYPCVC